MQDKAINQKIWLFRREPNISAKFGRYIEKGFSVTGIAEADRSIWAMYHDHSKTTSETLIDETKFSPPHVKFPSDGFAPDWFSFDGYDFCSAKMAEALAQPPDVIQYLPIIFECDGEAANLKQYRIIQILTREPIIDFENSDYNASVYKGFDTGAVFFRLQSVEKYVFLDGFTPNFEIFREAQDPSVHMFATDSLAERVLKAGCVGIEFQGLDSPSYAGGRPITIRTARGTKIVT